MLIKKIFCFSLIVISAVLFFSFGAVAIDVSAKSAVVIDSRTNEIIFQKSAFEKRSMASTTKIMTACLAIESGRLNETVNITAEMTKAEGTSIGLHPGDKISLCDLVYGMMLESGNDAANAVAVHLSGSLSSFAALMNKKAQEIGMESTNFVTPSGLDDEKHYSTAYDMALLASYCIKNPTFRNACSAKKYTARLLEPQTKLYFSNHNRLLSSVDGVFGVKTGFTKKSGRCLVSAIEKDGAVLVAVTLNAPNDWNDHKRLYDYALEKLEKKKVSPQYQKTLHVVGGTKSSVKIKAVCDEFYVSTYGNKALTQKAYLPAFVYAPLRAGDCVGRIEFFCGENRIKTVFLFAQKSVERIQATYTPKKSLKERIIDRIKSLF